MVYEAYMLNNIKKFGRYESNQLLLEHC